jgi:CIC family chloride channel protein
MRRDETVCLEGGRDREISVLAMQELSALLMRMSTENWFQRMKISAAKKVVIGGLVTGAIGFFIPDVLGTSYSLIHACFSAGVEASSSNLAQLSAVGFLTFFLMKAVATSFTVGSGGSGGVFAPALVCGGALGAASGICFEALLPDAFGIHPAAFALVGMAGFLASAVRIPMTAIVIVAEISGNHGLLLPAMWVCGISFWLNDGWSLYRSQPHSRVTSMLHG